MIQDSTRQNHCAEVLGEAMSIAGEKTDRGIRYCEIGTKTESSRRKVPFPEHVLQYLPPVITGPLFGGNANATSKRLNAFLRASGISDPAKTVHSLRHRAADKLRAVKRPQDVRYALLGHADHGAINRIAEDYGDGVWSILKEWVDKIDGI